jgi:glucose dehydrogenase
MLYVETASTCENPPWYGRISAIDTTTHTIAGTFYPEQGHSGGGIWGYGGASIDPSTNNVFIATGNADTTKGARQNAYYAEQVIELSPDVTSMIANNGPELPPGGDDLDFGATPMIFEPPGCSPLMAAINKSGTFFLYKRSDITAGPTESIQMSIVSDNGDFIGIPAYDPVTNYVYVEQPATYGIYKPGVAAFSISSCKLDATPVWHAEFGSDGAHSGDDTTRSPITIANGVLYISDYDTKVSYAFNAATGAKLWASPADIGSVVGPIVVNGNLYIGTSKGTLTEWSP